MRFAVGLVVILLAMLTACTAITGGKGEWPRYSTSNDCQAILHDWWGGPTALPPSCIERGP